MGDPAEYGAFLSIQHAARTPVERWLADNADELMMPPRMTSLLEADLTDLGLHVPAPQPLTMPADANPLGVAWVLGGSSLGNRAMLAERQRRDLGGPERFLSDRTMAKFFSALLPDLEKASADAEGSVAAANAVFETFLAAADAYV